MTRGADRNAYRLTRVLYADTYDQFAQRFFMALEQSKEEKGFLAGAKAIWRDFQYQFYERKLPQKGRPSSRYAVYGAIANRYLADSRSFDSKVSQGRLIAWVEEIKLQKENQGGMDQELWKELKGLERDAIRKWCKHWRLYHGKLLNDPDSLSQDDWNWLYKHDRQLIDTCLEACEVSTQNSPPKWLQTLKKAYPSL